MMKSGKLKYYLMLHFIVFIWGFTPIFGKVITLDAIPLVWYRILIALPAIFIFIKLRKASMAVDRKTMLMFFAIGSVIALHWLAFYAAVKINISVTMACFSCGAFFSAIIEPFFFKRKHSAIELIMGLIAIAGIGFIFTIETRYTDAIILSVLAALGSALFSVINGTLVKKYDSKVISLYELAGGIITLSIYFAFTGGFTADFFNVSLSDWGYLLIFGLVCTAFTFIASVEVMKEISPYTLNLTVNLESVYGIFWAYIIFKKDEQMSTGFYIGASLIFAVVALNAWLKNRLPGKKTPGNQPGV
jgi:drug/metabolite transporter (DMT)-like permease